MIDTLLNFFNDIKKFDYWNKLWKKKIVSDSKGMILRIYERKFRNNDEIKEIIKDNKNNVLHIKEYRYDDKGLLNKVLYKNGNGSIEYVNEIKYDKDYNIILITGENCIEDSSLYKICEYDNDGKIISDELVERRAKKQPMILTKNQYEYNGEGLLVKVKASKNVEVTEEYTYDVDKTLLNILFKDNNRIIGKIGFVYKNNLLNNTKLRDSITFKEVDYNGEIKDKFYGKYQYDDLNRIITDFRPFQIKGVYEENKINNFNIVFSKENYCYNDKINEYCRIVEEDEEGNIRQECFYGDKDEISKIVFMRNGKITYVNEYVYE
ncbi:hypothetical protein [Desnuesiella massiliensis]|uniref:hypothetical protein n=1 Tax=Desnuesiella massiliensis TaxID=1650662 RepID=UPI0006E29CA0|nr:hypothetical protein [Desnuesiella massiliensis]